jgi:hypothetical protein
MRKGQARAIGEQFSLPTTVLSRQVLKSIAIGKTELLESLPPLLHARVEDIRENYQRKVQSLGAKVRPRNLVYYHLIKDMYPSFHWVETNSQVQIETYFRGFKPNLLSYLLGLVPQDQIATTARMAALAGRGLNMEWIESCKNVFQTQGVCPMSDEAMLSLQRWIEKGRRGEQLSIVSPVCPDYSATEGESRKFRFTFDSVGTGAGLACLRLFQSLTALHKLFINTLGLPKIEHHVLVGDFEAFSAQNCERVGLRTEDFVKRLRTSCETISMQSPERVTVGLLTDVIGGRPNWEREYADMKQRFDTEEFGPMEGNTLFRDISDARKQLYRRWYNAPDAPDKFFEGLVVAQGIEYSTMGKVIAETFVNPLVLGADHHRMAPFYNFAADIPVVYLDRNYD